MAKLEIPIHIDGMEIIEQLKKEGKLVAVVRCKDCKHLYKDDLCPLRYYFTHTEDDFCSKGERKETGDEIG